MEFLFTISIHFQPDTDNKKKKCNNKETVHDQMLDSQTKNYKKCMMVSEGKLVFRSWQ